MTTKTPQTPPVVPPEVVKMIESGQLADRINAWLAEGEKLEELRRHGVVYYVGTRSLSYAKAGAHLAWSGERVRQIAESLGVRSRLARAARAARPRPRRARN